MSPRVLCGWTRIHGPADGPDRKSPVPDEIVFNETKISTSAFFSHPLYSTEDRRHNDIGMDRNYFSSLSTKYKNVTNKSVTKIDREQ